MTPKRGVNGDVQPTRTDFGSAFIGDGDRMGIESAGREKETLVASGARLDGRGTRHPEPLDDPHASSGDGTLDGVSSDSLLHRLSTPSAAQVSFRAGRARTRHRLIDDGDARWPEAGAVHPSHLFPRKGHPGREAGPHSHGSSFVRRAKMAGPPQRRHAGGARGRQHTQGRGEGS
jgi:hypothetical protein